MILQDIMCLFETFAVLVFKIPRMDGSQTSSGHQCHESKPCKWVFPKIGVPQNGWFMMETPIKIDDLGVPLFLELFLETPKS